MDILSPCTGRSSLNESQLGVSAIKSIYLDLHLIELTFSCLLIIMAQNLYFLNWVVKMTRKKYLFQL